MGECPRCHVLMGVGYLLKATVRYRNWPKPIEGIQTCYPRPPYSLAAGPKCLQRGYTEGVSTVSRSVLDIDGLGKEIFKDADTAEYMRELRDEWSGR